MNRISLIQIGDIHLPQYKSERSVDHKGPARKPFDQLAAFLALSMSRLFGARPHWGKICPLLSTDVIDLYPSFEKFREICNRLDPGGLFRNDWTTDLLSMKDRLREQFAYLNSESK